MEVLIVIVMLAGFRIKYLPTHLYVNIIKTKLLSRYYKVEEWCLFKKKANEFLTPYRNIEIIIFIISL